MKSVYQNSFHHPDTALGTANPFLPTIVLEPSFISSLSNLYQNHQRNRVLKFLVTQFKVTCEIYSSKPGTRCGETTLLICIRAYKYPYANHGQAFVNANTT